MISITVIHTTHKTFCSLSFCWKFMFLKFCNFVQIGCGLSLQIDLSQIVFPMFLQNYMYLWSNNSRNQNFPVMTTRDMQYIWCNVVKSSSHVLWHKMLLALFYSFIVKPAFWEFHFWSTLHHPVTNMIKHFIKKTKIATNYYTHKLYL